MPVINKGIDKSWCSHKNCIMTFNAAVPEIPNANITMNGLIQI